MIRAILGISGLIVELYSLSPTLLNVASDRTLNTMLLQHAAGNMLLVLFTWHSIPEKLRYPRPLVMLLLFNLSFFIPLFGLLGAFLAVRISGYRRRTVVSQPFASLALPEFTPLLREPPAKVSEGAIRPRLTHSSVPASLRLQSLLALQSMPPHVSSPLLHNMLGDASDDIRLVAYALLDSREKAITSRINRELANLKVAESKDVRAICQRQLAELYWELVYSGLVQDDLRIHALNQALYYADAALQAVPHEMGLWLLKGRILHQMKRDEDAYQVLEQAIANGLPESRVWPYIVEIMFDRGDYRTVRSLLSRSPASEVTPIMKGMMHFRDNRTEHKNVLTAEGAGP